MALIGMMTCYDIITEMSRNQLSLLTESRSQWLNLVKTSVKFCETGGMFDNCFELVQLGKIIFFFFWCIKLNKTLFEHNMETTFNVIPRNKYLSN
jgi:hypothetical protein